MDFLVSLPFVDGERICGSGSCMSVAGVKEPRLKAVAAIVPAISDISKSAMACFFKPEAGYFDLYDLAPYVSEAFEYIVSFFAKNLGKAE